MKRRDFAKLGLATSGVAILPTYPVSDRFFLRESDVRQALGTI